MSLTGPAGRSKVRRDFSEDMMHLRTSLLGLAILLAAGYAAPYLFLSDIHSWAGAFLFWLAFGSLVWVLLVANILRWNVAESRRIVGAADGPSR